MSSKIDSKVAENSDFVNGTIADGSVAIGEAAIRMKTWQMESGLTRKPV